MPEELKEGGSVAGSAPQETSQADSGGSYSREPSVDEASSGVSEGSTDGGVASGGASAEAGAEAGASPTSVQEQSSQQVQNRGYLPVRDALKTYGLDLPEGIDDHAALQQLVLGYRQAQQANQLAQYGQVYLQHADQFNAYLRQQQEQAAQQQAQQQEKPWWSKWWSPPDYDPSWSNLIQRTETGE